MSKTVTTETLTCDDLIVGCGVSGMTMALLLAATGRNVIVLEKSSVIGGGMQRFKREGVPFDTGFHFTAGLTGCMGDMLRVLNLRNKLETHEISTNILFTETGNCYKLPHGRDKILAALIARHPGEADSIRKYFDDEKRVFENTPLFDLRDDTPFGSWNFQPEEFITLADYFDNLKLSPELRCVLSAFATCHGSAPEEISFANHARVSYGLMDNMVRVKSGGDAFIQAFREEAEKLNIRIFKHVTIADCLDINRKHCNRIRLTDEREIKFENCIMTTHPKEILRSLPVAIRSGDFTARVNEFRDTCGFFTVFCTVEPPAAPFREELSSIFTTSDMNQILNENASASATGIMLALENTSTGKIQTLTAFQTVFPNETLPWKATQTGHRPAAYQAYKQIRTRQLEDTIYRLYPEFRGHLRILESASMLTFRDYLSPTGSAYGIRQKLNQHNIFGKLPLRNFYAIGQNTMLPGAMGAMLSAFIIFRKLAGEKAFRQLLEERLEEKR